VRARTIPAKVSVRPTVTVAFTLAAAGKSLSLVHTDLLYSPVFNARNEGLLKQGLVPKSRKIMPFIDARSP